MIASTTNRSLLPFLILLYALFSVTIEPTSLQAAPLPNLKSAPATTPSAMFSVNVLTDPGDGVCDVVECTLREALLAANATAGADSIAFTQQLSGTISLSSGPLPAITSNLTIQGPGADQITIDGNGQHRIIEVGRFDFESDTLMASVVVTISGLTLQGGRTFGAVDTPAAWGGAILINRSSTLALLDSAISNSEAAQGGAIYIDGAVLTIERSALYDNEAQWRANSRGGALYVGAGSVLTVRNSTLSGNVAEASGGALFTENSRVEIDSSTIAFNTIDDKGAGAGLYSQSSDGINPAGVISLTNTILAHNVRGHPLLQHLGVPDNFASDGDAIRSSGHNLSNTEPAGFTHPTDRVNQDPRLAPLGTYGGTTLSHALLNGSPAIDAGNTTLNMDQRHMPRPQDGNGSVAATVQDDIGAVEMAITGAPQNADALTVNTLADENDGACTNLHCTLREAMLTANGQPGLAIIDFSAGLSGTIALNGTQLPPVTTDLVIEGPGSDQLVISGADRSRVLEIGVTGGDAYSVTVRGVTLSDGNAPGVIQLSTGAGICVYHGNRLGLEDSVVRNHRSAGFGAAVTNSGTLIIRRSTLADSHGEQGGGGITNVGHLTLEQSTVSGNTSRGEGAGIRNMGIMTLTNSTISGNQSGSHGGGIYNGGTMRIVNSTLAYNRADADGNDSGQGGGIYQRGSDAQIMLGNTILAKNMRGNVTDNLTQYIEQPGSVTSLGFNLTDSELTALNNTGDLSNVDPRLGSLQGNGSAPASHAPTAGSPALDAGLDLGAGEVDQLGNPRRIDLPNVPNPTAGDGSDIGAVEAQSWPAGDFRETFLPTVYGE